MTKSLYRNRDADALVDKWRAEATKINKTRKEKQKQFHSALLDNIFREGQIDTLRKCANQLQSLVDRI